MWPAATKWTGVVQVYTFLLVTLGCQGQKPTPTSFGEKGDSLALRSLTREDGRREGRQGHCWALRDLRALSLPLPQLISSPSQ